MLTRRSAIALTLASIATPAWAAKSPVYARNGIAINGYDCVAYFTQSKPVKAFPMHASLWQNAVWQFVSQESRMQFETDPERYAPQYGGYCAYALSKGVLAKTSPDAWTVFEGKLYLNYDKNVRDIWLKDKAGNIERANKFWPDILK